jgi:sugar phosphate isomerase/epimerase
MNRYESNVITTASQALSLINRVGGGLGLLLDTFHMNIEEADPIQSVQDTMESIRHLHLADSNRAVPGTGHFPFSSLIRTLRDGGYGGSMGIETLPGPLALTDAAAAVDWYRQQTKVEAGRKG